MYRLIKNRLLSPFKKKHGQSLVEVSVAMTIVAVVSISMLSVVTATKNLLYNAEDKTKANSLAQEGIEIAREKRNEGCDFLNLPANDYSKKDDPDNPDYYIVESDTNNGPTDSSLIKYDPSNPGKDGNKINGFPGYERKIYLWPIDTLSSQYKLMKENFGSQTFDRAENYYLVSVEISWPSRYSGTMEKYTVSTIMVKKW